MIIIDPFYLVYILNKMANLNIRRLELWYR
jgi:hypothetical protein